MNATGGPPQIVLQVPPEILRLLTGILGCVQRIEQEVRECRLRLAKPVPLPEVWRRAAPEVESVTGSAPAPRAPKLAPAPAEKRGAYKSTHTPAGPDASKRMQALLARTNLSGVKLAEKLGTHQTTVSMIGRGRLGISRRLDEAMSRLESR